jgi:hypothetical protein
MSAIRFTGSGNFKIEAGVNYVKASITITWDDNASDSGIALKTLSFEADGRSIFFSRPDSRESGSETIKFNLSGAQDSVVEHAVSYTAKDTSLELKKESDRKIVFYDGDGIGVDVNAKITLNTLKVVRFDGAVGGTDPVTGGEVTVTGPTSCPPGPWSEPVPPSCGSPPTGTSATGGLQITKTGDNEITLNLKNYANKLVTLKITHQVNADWTQGFSFNIPTCSDLDPNTSGEPYSKGQYTNNSISGTNIFYAYNVDGGDYNYVFSHSSVPGPAPWRQLYELVCVESTDSDGNKTESCSCVPSSIEEFSPWPYCATGVAISKNGGNKVQWQYEDGGGGNYDDQYVTVEVVSVREAVSSSGPICMSTVESRAWVTDSNDTTADGYCIDDYRSHSSKIRFRIPSLQTSKTSFTDPVCLSDFRGIAGASSPSESLGTLGSDYKVLHIFDSDFFKTTSLTFDNRITVTEKNPTDTTQTSLDTTSRKYYEVQFNDSTVVASDVSNISVTSDQDLTADGIRTELTVSKTEQLSSNKLAVWFTIDDTASNTATDDITHVFDDDANTTTAASSTLSTPDVTIIPQSEDDEGNATTGYETLNADNKKHYKITFKDSTVVSADGSNINIIINSNTTASGLSRPIKIVKKEKIDNSNLKVWFTAYDSTADAGLETDNTFVRNWSVSRLREVDISGNVYARSWTLNVS